MKKMLLATFAVLISLIAVQAQQHVCGTSMQDQYDLRERMFRNRANPALQGTSGSRDVDYYVPIQIHIVGRTDGSQYISEAQVLDFLCTLNNDYADQDIQFYFKSDFNYINNDALYTNAQSNGGRLQISANRVNNAVNIFLTGNFPQTGLLGYYQGPANSTADYVVIKKSAVLGNTASHELGHFFSLAHPFFGWEPPNNPESYPGFPDSYQGWNEQYFGNPVGSNAPSYDFGFAIANEKVDQSNCNSAADGICDTPPDYLFAYSPLQVGCNEWNGGAMDPNGDLIDPMENNMMSYFNACANFTFTPQQKDAIINDLESNARNYIRPGYTPSTEEITEQPVLVSPVEGETADGYNYVKLDWDAVPGAQKYFVEIDRFQNFSFNPVRYVVSETSVEVLDKLLPSTTYYWRIRPFAEYITCGTPFSETRSVKTPSNTVNVGEIEAVDAWTVQPNPVSTDQVLTVSINATQSFEAEVNLYSLTGQLVRKLNNRDFGVGSTTIELSTEGLTPGLYLVAVNSREGVLKQKVVVTK